MTVNWRICSAVLFGALTWAGQSLLFLDGQNKVISAKAQSGFGDGQTATGPRQAALVTGAGQGTFKADLDGDGAIDGSYFGVAVHRVHHRQGATVEGHFICAMWGNTHFLGLTLMGVEGKVTSARIDQRNRIAWLKGVGTVDLGMGPSGFYTDLPFEVRVTEGGPGVGSVKLSVIGAFDGVPGDTEPGNGNYDLPIEFVLNGHILIP